MTSVPVVAFDNDRKFLAVILIDLVFGKCLTPSQVSKNMKLFFPTSIPFTFTAKLALTPFIFTL